jgi:hypothetical protein
VPFTTLPQPPLFLQEGEYSARLARNLSSFVGTEGVLGVTDLFVRQRLAGPAMLVEVLPGRAIVDGDDIPFQGPYLIVLEQVLELTVPAADTALPRVDLVVLRVLDSDAGVAGDEARVELLEGTPAAEPVPPAVPDTAIPLALITVAPNVTFILQSSITEARLPSGPLVEPQLNNLGDVSVPSPEDGDALVFQDGEWVAESPIGLIIALGG